MLYALRKSTGLPMTQGYPTYTSDQLIAELNDLGVPIPDYVTASERLVQDESDPEDYTLQDHQPLPEPKPSQVPHPVQKPDPQPELQPEDRPEPQNIMRRHTAEADPNELPGQRLNIKSVDEPIRIDDQGREWYQEEVRKPAYPKPRGRRVLKYVETGVRTQTVQNGEYIETFEVAGEGEGRPAEVKITLPSYQVGIYKDPRFPFRVHCYNGREGFNLFEVHAYYGGAELVPQDCKRVYIENDLCYDVRSVVRSIQNEFRQNQLTGRTV
jgi:hypothetical protein